MALPTPPGDLLDSSTMLSNLNELSKRELLRALLSELPQADLLETQTLIHGLLSRDFISLLPPELALHVLSFLDSGSDLLACGGVSKTWRNAANDPELWKALCDGHGDTPAISYHPALPISFVTRRQAELALRRACSGSRMRTHGPDEGIDEGWGEEEDPSIYLGPMAFGSGAGVVPPDQRQSLFPYGPIYRPPPLPVEQSYNIHRRSSPAALPSMTPGHPSVPLSFRPHPSSPSTHYAPNFKHLYLSSRLLSARFRASPPRSSPMPNSASAPLQRPFPAAHQFLSSEFSLLQGGLAGHDARTAIYSCALWRGDWALTGSRDCTIKIWDLSRRGRERVVASLEGVHTGSVLSLAVGPSPTARDDGPGAERMRVVSVGSDGMVVVWSVLRRKAEEREGEDWLADLLRNEGPQDEVTYEVETSFIAHHESVLCVRFDSSLIVTCSKDHLIKTFDATTFQHLKDIRGHRAAVNAVAIKDGLIVSASGDRTVRLWSAETGQSLAIFGGHSRGIASLDFDGRSLVTGSSDSLLRSFDIEAPQDVPGAVFGLSACEACSQRLHDPRCTCQCSLSGHTDLVRSVTMRDDLVASASYDGSIKLWDRQSRALVRDIKGIHGHRVFCVDLDQTKLISTGQDGKLVISRFDEDLDSCFLRL